MPAIYSPIELKNSLPDLHLNPGRRESLAISTMAYLLVFGMYNHDDDDDDDDDIE